MLRRIRREYLELPGLCLTLEQARRLWDLDEQTCRDAMQRLVETRFLCRAVVDAYDCPGGDSSENRFHDTFVLAAEMMSFAERHGSKVGGLRFSADGGWLVGREHARHR